MEINLGKLPFDLDFHPSTSIVAAGLIDGHLHLYHYEENSLPQRLLAIQAHDESCRAVRFIDSGRSILTGSSDCSILATDVETGKTIARLEDAHRAAVNRLINLTETTIASGDDEGFIKVWDTRQRTCCNSFDAHEEYISDMTFVPNSMLLLGTSGDGTLSVCSVRRNKVKTRSEFSEDELLSIVTMKANQHQSWIDAMDVEIQALEDNATWDLLPLPSVQVIGNKWVCTIKLKGNDTLDRYKARLVALDYQQEEGIDYKETLAPVFKITTNGRKVICGTQTGALLLYSWGYFKDCSDRFLGHPMSVDALLKFDEDTLISGSEDGVIRLVGILPNRIIQPIAEHSEYPIERLAFSHERKFLGSISHDQMLKLWDLAEILEEWHKAPRHQSDSDNDEMDVDIKIQRAPKGLNKKKAKNFSAATTSFFADM